MLEVLQYVCDCSMLDSVDGCVFEILKCFCSQIYVDALIVIECLMTMIFVLFCLSQFDVDAWIVGVSVFDSEHLSDALIAHLFFMIVFECLTTIACFISQFYVDAWIVIECLTTVNAFLLFTI